MIATRPGAFAPNELVSPDNSRDAHKIHAANVLSVIPVASPGPNPDLDPDDDDGS